MYVSVNYDIIGLDNGLLSIWQQTIISTNDDLLSAWPLGANFSEILIIIQAFDSRKCI